MTTNVAHEGALLVHPNKAYIMSHLTLPNVYREWLQRLSEDPSLPATDQEGFVKTPPHYISSEEQIEALRDPELKDYLLRLHIGIEALFGSIDFDLHTARWYTTSGINPHFDHKAPDDPLGEMEPQRRLVRMVTCVHNPVKTRPLQFSRPLWTGRHDEKFNLMIPEGSILAFGGSLITEYEHGIPPSAEAAEYRAVVTRFSRWEFVDDDGLL